MNFGHFELEEASEEGLAGARDGDFGVVVFVVNVVDDGAHGLALTEEVAWDRLALWEEQLVFVVVEEEGLFRPCLIHFAADELSLEVLEFVVDCFLMEVKDFGLESLTEREDGAAAEFLEEDFLGVLVADFGFGVIVIASVAERYLEVGVSDLAIGDNGEVLEDLDIAFVGVEDHVEVFVSFKHFGEHVTE